MRRPAVRTRPPTPTGRLSATSAVILVALLLGATALAGCGGGGGADTAPTARGGFDGAALPAGVAAPSFDLVDQDGAHVALGGRSGEVTIVAFVSSRCGRVCVLVAQQVRGALDRLARPVRTLFVSVDPAADTPARVARFLSGVSLAGRVRYLAAPATTLKRVWRAYRVVTPAAGRAAFERAVTVLLIDRDGAERVLYQPEQLTPESLVHDVGKLQGG